MKKAFTLIEILITLVIIGIIAAVVVPLVNNARPDVNKMLYLKTYNDLSTIIQKLGNNKDIYSATVNGVPDKKYMSYPFLNTSAVSYMGKTISGTNKLCQAIALGFKNDITACENGHQIVLDNGVTLKIDTIIEGDLSYYRTNILIDLNGAKPDNCTYDENSCKDPDQYTLGITANGQIYVTDVAGMGYRMSQTKQSVKDRTIKNLLKSPSELNKVFYINGSGMDRYY